LPAVQARASPEIPSSIYNVAAGDAILVVGLFHSARRPATTAATLEDRAGRTPDER